MLAGFNKPQSLPEGRRQSQVAGESKKQVHNGSNSIAKPETQ